MGKLLKGVVKLTVATAALGGLAYAFKDEIKETKVYKDNDVDGKIAKVKTTIKEKMPKVFSNEEDLVEDDEIFFDDEEFNPETASRDYVSITPVADAAEEVAEEAADAVEEPTEGAAEEDAEESTEEAAEEAETEEVPTIEA